MKKERNWTGWVNAHVLDRLWRLYRLSEDLGMPMHELSLRYVLSQPAIHSVIPGAQNLAEVEANYQAAIKGALPDDVLIAIQQMSQC